MQDKIAYPRAKMNSWGKILALAILIGALSLACSGSGNGGPALMAQEPPESSPSGNAAPVITPTASAEKLTYKIGPFSLPRGTKPKAMRESPGEISFNLEEPMWITSFESSIEDSQGEEIPSSLLHMFIITNSGEQNPLCTEKQMPNPFLAANSTIKNIDLPDGHGYAVLPEDELKASVVMQNPTTADYNNIFFTFTITGIPMRAAKNMKDISPMLLDIDPCDHTPIEVAPKEFVQKTGSFTVPESGLLVKAVGLLQNFAVEVSLSANGQPTPFWKALATLNEKHEILDLPLFDDPAGISLLSGDELTLGVAYENPRDEWFPDATGAAMVYISRIDETAKTMDTVSAQKMLLIRSNHDYN